MQLKLPSGDNLKDIGKEFVSRIRELFSSIQDKLVALSEFLTWKLSLAVILLVFTLTMGAFYYAFGALSHQAIPSDTKIYVTVKQGMTASEIADTLYSHGVIDSKLSFLWRTRFGRNANAFHSGTYLFSPGMDAEAVVAKLVSGETVTVKFTIPEGFTVKDIAERLDQQGLVKKEEFLSKAKTFAPYSYMKKGPDVLFSAEGYLFPDTYELHEDPSADNILRMMAEDFDQRLTQRLRNRAKQMNLSIHDLITLASLVEKEARYDEDRPIIAQVFFKRLKIGMPLQTDASLQYLMDAPKEDVSIADTKMDSPYNTYQHTGLPPGPVANPGMKAIEAVLEPSDTDYLYFVADRDGHNHYAANYAEHMRLVNQYR